MVRTGPRPAPPHLRFRKAASAEETKTDSNSIQDLAEPNTTSESSPLQPTADSLPVMTECAKDPSPTTTQTVADHSKTNSTKDPSPATTETALRRRKTNSSKDSLSVAVLAAGAAECPVSTPRSSDSDGGVELPPHLDTTSARGIVFGGEVDDNQVNGPDGSSGSKVPSATQDNPEPDAASATNGGSDSEPLLSVLDSLDCCNQS